MILKNRNYECDIKSNYKFAKEHSIENMANGMMNVYNQLLWYLYYFILVWNDLNC